MPDLSTFIASGGVVGALVMSALSFLRTSRRDKAESTVAEQTVDARIEEHGLKNLGARVDLETRVWTEERESLRRRIEDLTGELAAERADSARKDERLTAAERKLAAAEALCETLRNDLARVAVQLASVSRELSELRSAH